MPRGDRTGPTGMGAMTGRGAGYCAGSGLPGYAHDMGGRRGRIGFGRGIGFGGRGASGGGYGRRNCFYATGVPGWRRYGAYDPVLGYAAPYQTPDPEMEKQALKRRAEALRSELELIQQRLSSVEAGTTAT